ncbi:MAG: hypothetical protein IKK77_00025 [Clostridia bacterium]|nr:hypothetical protein [Clostridia bacterium]
MKKVLAALLCVVMMLTILPYAAGMTVSADTVDDADYVWNGSWSADETSVSYKLQVDDTFLYNFQYDIKEYVPGAHVRFTIEEIYSWGETEEYNQIYNNYFQVGHSEDSVYLMSGSEYKVTLEYYQEYWEDDFLAREYLPGEATVSFSSIRNNTVEIGESAKSITVPAHSNGYVVYYAKESGSYTITFGHTTPDADYSICVYDAYGGWVIDSYFYGGERSSSQMVLQQDQLYLMEIENYSEYKELKVNVSMKKNKANIVDIQIEQKGEILSNFYIDDAPLDYIISYDNGLKETLSYDEADRRGLGFWIEPVGYWGPGTKDVYVYDYMNHRGYRDTIYVTSVYDKYSKLPAVNEGGSFTIEYKDNEDYKDNYQYAKIKPSTSGLYAIENSDDEDLYYVYYSIYDQKANEIFWDDFDFGEESGEFFLEANKEYIVQVHGYFWEEDDTADLYFVKKGDHTNHTYNLEGDHPSLGCTECSYYINEPTLKKVNGTWRYFRDGHINYADTLVKFNGIWFHVRDSYIYNERSFVEYNGYTFYTKDGQVDFSTTLVQVDNYYGNYDYWYEPGVWYYIKDGKLDTTETLVKFNGIWFHVKDGVIDYEPGFVKFNGYWFYTKDGRLVDNTGLKKVGSEWYYMTNGSVNKTTTFVKFNDIWFYVENGKVNFNKTGLVKIDNTWFYVKEGRVDYSNTLVKHGGIWFHVNNGQIDYESKTLVKFNGIWFYVKDGQINYSPDIVEFNGVTFYVNNGQLTSNSGLTKVNGTWYYLKNGQLDLTDTLVKFNGIWFHVKNGGIDYNPTLVKFNGIWFYVNNGQISYETDLVWFNGYWFYVKNGEINYSKTLVKIDGTWMYVNDGVVDYEDTLVKFNGIWFHVNNGVIDYSTCIVNYNGYDFFVKDGEVQFITATVRVNDSVYEVVDGIATWVGEAM